MGLGHVLYLRSVEASRGLEGFCARGVGNDELDAAVGGLRELRREVMGAAAHGADFFDLLGAFFRQAADDFKACPAARANDGEDSSGGF